MSAADPFFDTNVLLYLLSADAAKADRAEMLVDGGGVISVQVLNEFASVALRKFKAPWAVVRDAVAALEAKLRVESLTRATHHTALNIAERYRLTIYDSDIIAAATLAGCDTLYSEDMQDGQAIGGLTIRNPFATLS